MVYITVHQQCLPVYHQYGSHYRPLPRFYVTDHQHGPATWFTLQTTNMVYVPDKQLDLRCTPSIWLTSRNTSMDFVTGISIVYIQAINIGYFTDRQYCFSLHNIKFRLTGDREIVLHWYDYDPKIGCIDIWKIYFWEKCLDHNLNWIPISVPAFSSIQMCDEKYQTNANSQILQCACSISYNAPFRTEHVYIYVLNGAFWDMEEVHCEICETGLLV